MQRRFFLKALAGVAVALAVPAIVGADEAMAKPLANGGASGPAPAPAEDMPAAEAHESQFFFYRRRRFYRPRRRIFFYRRPRRRIYFYRRPRRVFFYRRRRFW